MPRGAGSWPAQHPRAGGEGRTGKLRDAGKEGGVRFGHCRGRRSAARSSNPPPVNASRCAPITFDNYVAMKDGPVPSATRDVLQPKFDHRAFYDETWPPWDRVPSPQDGARAFKFVRPKRQPNVRVLSESDRNALAESLSIVK